jgi:hydroxymethylpyrimidine kinase/phosphomethylpyrimidine kinase/thiamine-phosphate diphosphorylase
LLDAQLAALADDIPPAAIKTGLLGSADNVRVVLRWLERLRRRASVALVVDPVLRASTGADFADAALLVAYRELLGHATLVTPNDAEAARLLGRPAGSDLPPADQMARALRALGPLAVAITGGDRKRHAGWSLDWIDAGHAQGWLALPRVHTVNNHGTGCTFATAAACGLALGFVPEDALVLAKMAAAQALRHGHTAGQGAGPVGESAGFGVDPSLLPDLSWGDERGFLERIAAARSQMQDAPGDIGLYAIVDRVERVRQVLDAGVKTVQLRIKTPKAPDAAWRGALQQSITDALALCCQADAVLVVNDHWRLALQSAGGDYLHLAIHLGQEDLSALDANERRNLAEGPVRLGVSSHSLWELARARGLAPWTIACGPVWPTLTKAMPWRPQGLDNLAWWVRMAGAPVVAIGGILDFVQARQAARSGAAGVCVVRGLGESPARTVPRWQQALAAGRADPPLAVPPLPHPSLAMDGTGLAGAQSSAA